MFVCSLYCLLARVCSLPPAPPEGGKVTVLGEGLHFGKKCLGSKTYEPATLQDCDSVDLNFLIGRTHHTVIGKDKETINSEYTFIIKTSRSGKLFWKMVFSQPISVFQSKIVTKVGFLIETII